MRHLQIEQHQIDSAAFHGGDGLFVVNLDRGTPHALLEGEDFALFFYGQRYGLSIFESGFAAILFSIFGPALLTWILLRYSGAVLLERRMRRSRPGFDEYAARTSRILPWPPSA